jgi:hypothetical protein
MEKFILEEINKPKPFYVISQNEAFLKQVILKEKLGILFGIKESLVGGNPTRITMSVSMYPKSQIYRIIELEDKITNLIQKISPGKLAAEKNKNLIDYLQLNSLLNIPKDQLLNSPHNLYVTYDKISPYMYHGNLLKNIFDTLFSTTDRNKNKLNILDAYFITKGYLDVVEYTINAIPLRTTVFAYTDTVSADAKTWYFLYLGLKHYVKVIHFLGQMASYMVSLFLQFPFNHIYNNNLDFILNGESNFPMNYFWALYQLVLTKPYIYLDKVCTLNELESKMKLIHELLLQYIDNE